MGDSVWTELLVTVSMDEAGGWSWKVRATLKGRYRTLADEDASASPATSEEAIASLLQRWPELPHPVGSPEWFPIRGGLAYRGRNKHRV